MIFNSPELQTNGSKSQTVRASKSVQDSGRYEDQDHVTCNITLRKTKKFLLW